MPHSIALLRTRLLLPLVFMCSSPPASSSTFSSAEDQELAGEGVCFRALHVKRWAAFLRATENTSRWEAVALRAGHRGEYLDAGGAWNTFLSERYDGDDRVHDETWANDLRLGLGTYRPSAGGRDIWKAPYPLEHFVGLAVGRARQKHAYSDRGLVYKVYASLGQPTQSLTWPALEDLARRLDDAGFSGDFKVALAPGRGRFLYNTVVVHAFSIRMARLAEHELICGLGDDLVAVGRGVDTRHEGTGKVTVWHELLLRGDGDKFDDDVLGFLNFSDGSISSCDSNQQ